MKSPLIIKKGCITVLYRSPSLSSSEIDNFLSDFENILNVISSFKPDFPIILGDFNPRSRSRWQNDINTSEGTKTDALTSYHDLHQLTSQPTHILVNSSSSIDLIFTDQPNLVTDCGTHPSLHPNCHHQIISCKLNLKIDIVHLIKDYSGTSKELILIQFGKQLK